VKRARQEHAADFAASSRQSSHYEEMVEHMPDAGSYASVTILIDERPDAVNLSYDTTGSILATLWKFCSFEHRKESG
jgi:hypothetical protein